MPGYFLEKHLGHERLGEEISHAMFNGFDMRFGHSIGSKGDDRQRGLLFFDDS